MDLAYGIPKGINFRSVEFEDFPMSQVQHILNGCAHSVENLTIAARKTGTHQPLSPPSAIRLIFVG